MQNETFHIEFDPAFGTVRQISHLQDPYPMNWCAEDGRWGEIFCTNLNDEMKSKEASALPLLSFEEGTRQSASLYGNANLSVLVERYFLTNGNFAERYTLKNLRDTDLFLEHGDLAFVMPFNDVYTYADDCMRSRCNTHLWCGHDITYINALRMGENDINLGLFLNRGSIHSYSVNGCKHSHRGAFLLNCGHIELLPEEEYVWEYQFFWHTGKDDFWAQLRSFDRFIEIKTDAFTVSENDVITFDVLTGLPLDRVAITCDNSPVSWSVIDGGLRVRHTPQKLCENRFDISIDGISTYTEFFVTENIEAMLEKRIHFIIDHQQYHRPESCLDGSFMIYDTREKNPVFNSVIRDHNACRERLGMALFIAKYLQTHQNDKFEKALDQCIRFVLREIVDTQTGEVFDGAGKAKQFVRLYNAPWITTLFTEMYELTGDIQYLEYTYTVLRYYYSSGGRKFYPNGLSMYKTYTAFYCAGLTEKAEEIKRLFLAHIDNMVANGTSYPRHEVNYEQTIVSPAATFTSEMARLTRDEKYIRSARDHIRILERFNFNQPSFHLNEIPIRFWDNFWFGKARLYGDTFPHYWACLTARAYSAYYHICGDKKYKNAALMCIQNCFCLFNQTGEGSCCYVYPFKLNGEHGRFYDEWANDQDFALYFYLVIQEMLNEPRETKTIERM